MNVLFNFIGLLILVGGLLLAYYIAICKLFISGLILAISNASIVNGVLQLNYAGAYLPALLMFFSPVVASILGVFVVNASSVFFKVAKEF